MPANLLSADDATFDTSLGHWTGPSISRVTTPTPHAGSGVLAATDPTLGATFPLGVTPTIPAGDIVTISAWMQTTGSGVGLRITFTSDSYHSYASVGISGASGSWVQRGHSIVIPGAGTSALSIAASPGYVAGDIGYLSDVFIGHEPVNGPTFLTATPSGGTVGLSWTLGPVQHVGFFDTPLDVLADCDLRIERADDGGSFSEINVSSLGVGGVTSYTDFTTSTGHHYDYRIRYGVHGHTGLVAYSAYSNTAGVSFGGWGVGMVRMNGA